MKRQLKVLVLLTLLASIAAVQGCAACCKRPAVATVKPGHLIFNSKCNFYTYVVNNRSDWPSSTQDRTGGETTEYRLFVYDRQGGRNDHANGVHRQFQSIRSGRLQK